MSIDKALQQCFKDSIKIKKLWTNASPNSSFAKQQIKINGKNYDYYKACLQQEYLGNKYNVTALMPVGGNTQAEFTAAAKLSAYVMCIDRSITSSSAEVDFNDARYKYVNSNTVNTANSNLIPLAIYGIKLMGGGTA